MDIRFSHAAPPSPCKPALVHAILFEGVGALYECKAEDGEGVREGRLLEGKHVELPVVHFGQQSGDLVKSVDCTLCSVEVRYLKTCSHNTDRWQMGRQATPLT